MNSLLLAVPWLVLGIPVTTIVIGLDLRRRAKLDYAHYIEWKEFPLRAVAGGKILLFTALALSTAFDAAPAVKTIIALVAVGGLGHLVEYTIVFERPLPTMRYKPESMLCPSCRAARHHECTNLRMLDGYEKGFVDDTGYSRPVCCCGFRLGAWEEVEV